MALERSRRRKLAQLVPDHILGNVDRNVTFAVMHAERQSDHVGRDRRTSRPGSNHLRALRARANSLDDFPDAFIHQGAFF